MSSEEDFFSEFYYPDKTVTENEGNVEVLSISRALPIYQWVMKLDFHRLIHYILPTLNRFVLSDMLNSFNTSETLLTLDALLATEFITSYSAEYPLTKPIQNQKRIQNFCF